MSLRLDLTVPVALGVLSILGLLTRLWIKKRK